MNINLSGKRVALIGGAGFIGHNIALKLKKLGADPHVIDSLQVNNLGAFTHNMNANPNDKLYVGFINERLDLLRRADIPLHIVDARDYALLGGRTLIAGKPHRPIYEAALAAAGKRLGRKIERAETLAIGDGMLTDVKGADDMGLDVLYVSGGIHAREYGEAARPDPLRLSAFLEAHGRRPVIVVHQHRRARPRPEPFGVTHMVGVVMGEHDGLDG